MEEEWFEFDPDLTLGPGPHRKAAFYADEDVPQALIEEMRQHGLRVRAARELGAHGKADETHAALCAQKGWVLITRDEGFWDERRFPTTRSSPGIIILGGRSEEEIGEAMALVWVLFAKHFPGNSWSGIKARAKPHIFRLRLRDFTGRVVEYDLKLSKDRQLMVREVPRSPRR
jgi:predicted nuclease of predicted toxin-antitoxin system